MNILPSNQFPYFLKQINSCPEFLYYDGNIELISKKCITFVGTRQITPYGKYCIELLLDEFLRKLDICVVSGLALGVDAYVHEICLKKGISTIAIIPGSIDSPIPKANREIFEKLETNGLILAEYLPGTKLQKHMFVLRNRLLAAISETTIVIEAGLNSGSLITANFALEFDRDIYVIPGNINNNMSRGCNMLAKQGAGIISCLDDLKDIFGIQNEQATFRYHMGVQGK